MFQLLKGKCLLTFYVLGKQQQKATTNVIKCGEMVHLKLESKSGPVNHVLLALQKGMVKKNMCQGVGQLNCARKHDKVKWV